MTDIQTYAARMGYNTPAWHGTYASFDEFNQGDIGFHFSKDRKVSEMRLSDKDHSESDIPIYLHVALSIHHPLKVNCDFENWDAEDLFKAATFDITDKPFECPTVMYITQQRKMASAAHRILMKAASYSDQDILDISSKIQKEPRLNSFYTQQIGGRLAKSPYDSIIYQNDFEVQEDTSTTCYIVFRPNQIKSLDVSDKPLNERFLKNSPRFRD